MSLIRGVGAAENFRQRNIFPLPELGPDEGGTTGGDDWRVFANQGITTLNHLAGCYNSDFHIKKGHSCATPSDVPHNRVLQGDL